MRNGTSPGSPAIMRHALCVAAAILIAIPGAARLQAAAAPGELLKATVLDPLYPGQTLRLAVSWRGAEQALLSVSTGAGALLNSRLQPGIKLLELQLPPGVAPASLELAVQGPDTAGRELTRQLGDLDCFWDDGFAGAEPDDTVRATAVFDDGSGPALFVGGSFRTVASHIAKWDGTSWSPLTDATTGEEGTSDDVFSLAVYDDGGGPALYAGGSFSTAGGVDANNIARWDGTNWTPLTDAGTGEEGMGGFGAFVFALTVHDDGGGPALYAGGQFGSAGAVTASGIAKWDGTNWTPLTDAGSGEEGTDSQVRSLAAWDDGTGTALYVGGNFQAAGGVMANRIARWDGSNWSPLTDAGTGQQGMSDDVLALAVYDDGGGEALYAGGDFTTAAGMTARRIARWDGSNWTALADAGTGEEGTSGSVEALVVYDDGGGAALYVGGQYIVAGGMAISNIARWDGTNWSPLINASTGQEGTGSAVRTLSVFDAGEGVSLFAGGLFTSAGGQTVSRIGRWDGTDWTGLTDMGMDRQGLNGAVHALAVYDDGGGGALYAGGEFTRAGGVTASHIARWDGNGWTPLVDAGTGQQGLGGFSPAVFALAVYDDGGGPGLYAGGEFDDAGGVAASNIARWDGTNWTPLADAGGDEGTTGDVLALTVYDDGGGPGLYAGGNFFRAGAAVVSDIARWDGTSWAPLADAGTGEVGVDFGPVAALAAYDEGSGPALFVGGDISSAGGMTATNIARWDGVNWTTLTEAGTGQEGIDDEVHALAVYDDGSGPGLYASGQFTSAGGVTADRIARWDGANWTPLTDAGTGDQGTGGALESLAVYDDGGGDALYAAGQFFTAGGVTAWGVARWDGTNWSALADTDTGQQGISAVVHALAAYGDEEPVLYAGGDFFEAGGRTSAFIGAYSCPPESDVLFADGFE